MTLADDYRLSIDRECISFKKIYALRTESERYNSRFKSTGQERLWVHGINAARNLNTIAHIALLATAVAAVVTKSKCSYCFLKSVKRIAGLFGFNIFNRLLPFLAKVSFVVPFFTPSFQAFA